MTLSLFASCIDSVCTEAQRFVAENSSELLLKNLIWLCPLQHTCCNKSMKTIQVCEVTVACFLLPVRSSFQFCSIAGPPIHHFDLYRLDSSSGISRLDLPYSFSHAVSLIEWAGKLHQLPSELLEVHITLLDEQSKVCANAKCMLILNWLYVVHLIQAKLRSNSTVLEDAADSSSSEEELAFEDRHWRKICLQPTGSSWVERVTAVTEDVVKHGEQHGKDCSGHAMPMLKQAAG